MMKKALPAPLDLPPSPACAGFGRAGLKERPAAQFSNMHISLIENNLACWMTPFNIVMPFQRNLRRSPKDLRIGKEVRRVRRLKDSIRGAAWAINIIPILTFTH